MKSKKVLCGSAHRRMYFPVRRSPPARPESDYNYWTDSTLNPKWISSKTVEHINALVFDKSEELVDRPQVQNLHTPYLRRGKYVWYMETLQVKTSILLKEKPSLGNTFPALCLHFTRRGAAQCGTISVSAMLTKATLRRSWETTRVQLKRISWKVRQKRRLPN